MAGGLHRYCCIMPAPAKRASGEVFEMWSDRFADVWNGDELVDIRRRMLAGERVSLCHKCHEEEAAGGRSLRIDHNERWLGQDDGTLARRIDATRSRDGVLDEPPIWIELKLGNVCNLRCRMCSPNDSNQIQAEYGQLCDEDPFFERLWGHERHVLWHHKRLPLVDVPPWTEGRFLWDQVDALLPTLRKVSIVGGEPTMIEAMYEFLERAVAGGHAPRLELQFNTNLTSLRPRFLELLGHFAHVHLSVSFDGVGAVQEYIRYPSRWASVERNFRTLVASSPPSVSVVVAPTVQSYNVLGITDLYRWIESVAEWRYNPITPNILDEPYYLSFRCLPIEVRKLAADRIDAYRDEGRLPRTFEPLRQRLDVISSLLRASHTSRDGALDTFRRFTATLDRARGQQLRTAIPELSSVLVAPNDPDAT